MLLLQLGQTFADLIKKYPNLAITRTMDKAFSLAGLRLGYLLMGDFFKNHFSDFPTYLSTPALYAAIEALKKPQYMIRNVGKIMHEKSKIEKELLKTGIVFVIMLVIEYVNVQSKGLW